MTSDQPRSGGCLCGAVRYRARGALRPALYCHCGQCRRTHGHFAAYTAVPAEALELDEQHGLSWFRSSPAAERGFCRECGASLFWRRIGGDVVGIAAGSLEN
ncbi:MAG TPA: GFA family protein, partial [Geminicoccaceae bacterium]|nr:GFA family protein [Geminicoccaceae bacterium]